MKKPKVSCVFMLILKCHQEITGENLSFTSLKTGAGVTSPYSDYLKDEWLT